MRRTYKKILEQSVRRYRYVQVERDDIDSDDTDGYVLDLSSELVLLFEFRSFVPCGCAIVRLADVTRVSHEARDRTIGRILAAEGLLDSVGCDVKPDISSMGRALVALQSNDVPVAVQIEKPRDESSGDEYYVGIIERIDTKDQTCWLRDFDSEGVWSEETLPIAIEDVTRVEFETPYVRTFFKHIGPPPLFE